MTESVHRSENLVVTRGSGAELHFELRFPTSVARGVADATCPRCGGLGDPERWEIEGPEMRGNTVWLQCAAPRCAGRSRWTRSIEFGDWEETE